ncbi:flagellar hook capping FlgD N-terminal domain-containing protein [Sedimentitalea todarodis]|uniref:Basal-body rod modification protein FlgD n=1 Tax=Sedimentitalea todarodis TaxID=1631240 RepID=A0ABU3VA80_9RHOB|nr:flagellar hook capping FlgD N-terminal domain-containing protein [Sedimentitalea todarodis]MDU9003082.1 flagellar hook capping FlgD N-terminal domain-containing protein [Sedimentitalea todarodis]
MTEITTSVASVTASTAARTASVTSSASGSAGLTSDFETFLKMLTAQARYQDPLEPIDSTEYAAQLAQFSMVEQQVQTNDTLTALFAQMDSSNMAALAGWVGMEIRADTPVYFDGQPVTVSPGVAPTADAAYLVVTGADGREVQRSMIDLTGDPVQWAGVDDSGAPFANGVYAFSVASFRNGTEITPVTTEVYGRISEAQFKDNAVVLVLEGGPSVAASEVSALREGG